MELSFPKQLIVTTLFKVLEDVNTPSKIRLPAGEALTVKKESSSVLDKDPFGTMLTPETSEPEKIPSTSVIPEVSLHDNDKSDGGEPLNCAPIAL